MEVKPLSCVLHSSRNEDEYLKTMRESLLFAPPENLRCGYDGKNLGAGSEPVWFQIIPAMSSMNFANAFKVFRIF